MTRIALTALAASAFLVASSVGQPQVAPATATADAAVYTPPPPLPSQAERMRLRSGMAAAESSDWSGLAQLRDGATDPLIRRMLQWRWASSTDAPLYFDDIAQALTELQGWPGRTTMRTRAEEAILSSRLSASDRVAFLRSENGPITGDGRMALAISLKANGQRSEAAEIARAAWRDDALSTEMEDRALAEFSSAFTSEDHAARVDGLLWRDQHTAARRLLPRVSTADRLLANARIA
ncbi:MAG: hypothetical protein H7124_17795, partial [Phycisphaerales bacterium]|nr:hypothetical protein [Hyphomonadaceae bacterium]